MSALLTERQSAHWLEALATALETRGGPLQALEALRYAGPSSLAASAGVRGALQRRLPLSSALVEVGVLSASEGLALARVGASQRPGADEAIQGAPPPAGVIALIRVFARRRQRLADRRRAVLVGAAGPLVLLWVSAAVDLIPNMILGGGSSAGGFVLPILCTALVLLAVTLTGRPGRDPGPIAQALWRLPPLSRRILAPDLDALLMDALGALVAASVDVARGLGVLEALALIPARKDWIRRAQGQAQQALTTAPGALVEAGPGDETLALTLIAGEAGDHGARLLLARGAEWSGAVTQRMRIGARWALYLVAIYMMIQGLIGGLSAPIDGGGGLGFPMLNLDPGQMQSVEQLLQQLQP